MFIRKCLLMSGLMISFLLLDCTREGLPPESVLTIAPTTGTVTTWFDLDASKSTDPDGIPNLLMYRWDFENDGIWDTDFGRNQAIAHSYKQTGIYFPVVEIMDPQGLSDTTSLKIVVNAPEYMIDPRDGRKYPVIHLGKLIWMARNLDYGNEINGSQEQTNNGIPEKYRYPGEDTDSLYGGLYQWEEAMDYYPYEGSRGICPQGWRIPTEADWTDLMTLFKDLSMPRYAPYVLRGCRFIPDQVVQPSNYSSTGSVIRMLKSTGNSGFDALLVGYRNPDGNFGFADYHFPGQTASFWTSTSDGTWAIRNRMYFDADHSGEVFYFADNKKFGFSIRCVKNANQ